MELYLFFANILKNFEIVNNDPHVSLNNFSSSIVRAPDPYKIRFVRRDIPRNLGKEQVVESEKRLSAGVGKEQTRGSA